ncbi:MAG: hypothetical protein DWQ47_11100 [Acidobacteria bacterium]|nr:MAG: hypothetical protein DWQ32_13515 [Acidobacteriota bacterium]REJ98126.1 MAG: hypothetical protein DWQ38_16315 [Acidobacteriota bacterium]REK16869.1 MAG: hypothetical protein DWQ43_01360 [Acidobacteriota bacterium]REK42780.1 MAG: hypothetical protein DWQ47_11100 [Acidobacteriota bacterium]
MKQFSALIAILFLSLSTAAQDIEALKANIIYLSSDELGGRGPGSEGARKAADYIAEQFKKVGLKPFRGDSYFQPFDMPNQDVPERNVIGYIPAKEKTDRSIVFTAHYDGYGIVESVEGDDKIHNAAQDNAAGVAGMIEMARIYSQKKSPTQNLVFIATAAEEGGARTPRAEMTGADFYALNPLFPLSGITINLNIDGFNNLGPAADYWVMPRQGVDFVDELRAALKPFPMNYAPPDWIDGMNKSFDTQAFLSRGVPAVTIWTGFELREGAGGKVPRFGRIHAPDDEYNDTWRFDAAEEFLRMYEAVADRYLESGKRGKVTDLSLFKEEAK